MIELFIFTTSDFLFECSKYDEDRESMLFEITTVCSNFIYYVRDVPWSFV